MENPVVIVNPEGKFLASAWFATGQVVKARWVTEYPDCAEFTADEAWRTVRKLRDAGQHCRGILRYGYDDEAVIA